MKNRRNDEQISKIIKEYLDSQNQDVDDARLKKLFAYWFYKDEDREAKDKALDLIDARLPEIDGLSAEESQAFAEKVLAVYHMNKAVVRNNITTLRRTLVRVAAVIVPFALITGAWIFFTDRAQETNKDFAQVYEVPYGGVNNELLGDSTKVAMNAGSKLSVTQNSKERVAELVGESYFSVAKDPDRPFVVKTRDLTVTVLGTEFNVEAYPDSDKTIITLNSGKVEIKTANNERYILEPNQQFTYERSISNGVVKKMDQEEATNISEWKNGMLVLDDVDLYQALKAIERHYNIDLEIQDRTIEGRLFGKFASDATVEEVMKGINDAVPTMSYKFENNKLTINQR